MTRFIGPLGVVSVLVVSILFAALNGAQRVTLNLGVTILYGVPLTLVGFTGLFMGMVVMLVAGIRSDLRVRAVLRQRLEDEDREERALIDRTQPGLEMTGQLYAAVGDRETTLDLLEQASHERAGAHNLLSMKVNPLYDFLRDHPRFQDLLRRIGLED